MDHVLSVPYGILDHRTIWVAVRAFYGLLYAGTWLLARRSFVEFKIAGHEAWVYQLGFEILLFGAMLLSWYLLDRIIQQKWLGPHRRKLDLYRRLGRRTKKLLIDSRGWPIDKSQLPDARRYSEVLERLGWQLLWTDHPHLLEAVVPAGRQIVINLGWLITAQDAKERNALRKNWQYILGHITHTIRLQESSPRQVAEAA